VDRAVSPAAASVLRPAKGSWPGWRLENSIQAIDLRGLDRHRDTALTGLIPALSCRSCRPHAHSLRPLRLSQKSIADEMREDNRRPVRGERGKRQRSPPPQLGLAVAVSPYRQAGQHTHRKPRCASPMPAGQWSPKLTIRSTRGGLWPAGVHSFRQRPRISSGSLGVGYVDPTGSSLPPCECYQRREFVLKPAG
jgi:hypothetical protein